MKIHVRFTEKFKTEVDYQICEWYVKRLTVDIVFLTVTTVKCSALKVLLVFVSL